MEVLYEVDLEDGYICEVIGCSNGAEIYALDVDGRGFVCRACFEAEKAQKDTSCKSATSAEL